MARIYHCACCGQQLDFYRKAVPKKGIILNLIAPHECSDKLDIEEFKTEPFLDRDRAQVQAAELEAYKSKSEMEKIFNSFPFVDKINKEGLSDPLPITDRREKEVLRKPLSTAPPSLLEMAGKTRTGPIPGRELEVPEDGDAE